MAAERIKCAVPGCKWSGHIIAMHLKEKHDDLSVFDYAEKYDAPIASALGFAKLREVHGTQAPLTPREPQTISDVFGLPKWDGKDPETRFLSRSIDVFEGESTEPVDENYTFQTPALKRLLIAFTLSERNHTWMHGYSGTGKTAFARQVAARLHRKLSRINGDIAISRRHFIGDYVVRGGQTVFNYGILPIAMREGHILLIDEIDMLDERTLGVLRSVLEHPSTLTILENGGERITAHPDFRVIATANTTGAGDETGLFASTRALSAADRQRFSIWIKLDYMDPVKECEMVQRRFPKITMPELRRWHQVVRAIRERHKAGEFEESISPREIINLVEKYLFVGTAMEAARMCLIDRLSNPAAAMAVEELVRAAFDDASTPEELPGEENKP